MQQSNLDDLRAFVALADSGSFAGAGRLLGKDATVISRRLKALEAQLGVRLAERTTRRVALTEAGRVYLRRVRPLLYDLDAANRDATSFADGDPRGHLRLALPGTFGRMWLQRLIVEFLKAHPKVTIEADYSDRFVDLIGEGYDLAVRLGELPDSRLIARKIGDRRRLVCASPAYLIARPRIEAPSDLATHACLTFTGRIDPFRWVFRHLGGGGDVDVTVSGPLASSDAEVLKDAAIAGLGVLYTTDWHVGDALARGDLLEVLDGWPVADAGAIHLVTPAAGGTPSKTRAFSDWIRAGISAAPWLAGRSSE